MRKLRPSVLVAMAIGLMVGTLPQAKADDPLAPVAPDITKLTWSPKPNITNLDDWQTFNAYNVIHYVSKNLPNRQPNDQSATDPVGPGNVAGCLALSNETQGCPNHQLEYLAWFEDAFTKTLGDFGVTFRTYEFNSPGSTLGQFATNAGVARNKLAIVPGADNPEDLVLIGTHYDQVDGSPYAAWDQSAGTGVLVRTAKMLSDYWKSTGTRPSKTYVFAAWDAEEAGLHGSAFYVGTENSRSAQNGTLSKDPDVQLTAYLNHDPCGAAYPALYRGMPVSRQAASEKTGFIPVNVALHPVPTGSQGTTAEKAHFQAFNDNVPKVINDVFNYVDDTLPVAPGNEALELTPVMLSKEEAAAMGSELLEQESVLKINTAGSLVGFSTDAESFHRWIPTMNPYPDILGPHRVPNANNPNPADVGWSADAAVWVHNPLDSFEGLVAYTSADQAGVTYSKGLAMSWELCSMLSAWTMIQPSQGGLQVANTEPVAFFETPQPNRNGGTHKFDASGSYRYVDVETREKDDTLEYRWEFSDGTTDEGKVVTHSFPTSGGTRAYRATLTVFDPETEQSDTMTMKIGTGTL